MLEKSRDMPDGAFRKRPVDADKYSVGTVAVIGGSTIYPNAPVIAGLGARAAGAGLVSLVVPEESRMCAAAHLPEATFARFSVPFLPPRADVFVVGMGLGVSADSEQVVSSVLSGNCGRFVLDADALTIIAGWSAGPRGFAPAPGQEIIMTPHEGEAARLLGATRESVKSDRLSAAKVIATKYGATVVLKGPGTLVVSNDALAFMLTAREILLWLLAEWAIFLLERWVQGGHTSSRMRSLRHVLRYGFTGRHRTGLSPQSATPRY